MLHKHRDSTGCVCKLWGDGKVHIAGFLKATGKVRTTERTQTSKVVFTVAPWSGREPSSWPERARWDRLSPRSRRGCPGPGGTWPGWGRRSPPPPRSASCRSGSLPAAGRSEPREKCEQSWVVLWKNLNKCEKDTFLQLKKFCQIVQVDMRRQY